jgi:hypothetical protein
LLPFSHTVRVISSRWMRVHNFGWKISRDKILGRIILKLILQKLVMKVLNSNGLRQGLMVDCWEHSDKHSYSMTAEHFFII